MVNGIKDVEVALGLANVVVQWSFNEDQMISVLGILIFGRNQPPSRQIYKKLSGSAARADLMRILLQKTELNKDKSEEFDSVINEFSRLSEVRNRYVHGLWWTHENGETYLQEATKADFDWLNVRKIEVAELTNFLVQSTELWNRTLSLTSGFHRSE